MAITAQEVRIVALLESRCRVDELVKRLSLYSQLRQKLGEAEERLSVSRDIYDLARDLRQRIPEETGLFKEAHDGFTTSEAVVAKAREALASATDALTASVSHDGLTQLMDALAMLELQSTSITVDAVTSALAGGLAR